jgi:hypothetical protein
MRVLSQAIWASMSCVRRPLAPARRFCSAAPEEGAQLLRLGVGQWPRRRADHVGKVGQGAGIQGIRLGQLPGGTRTIARLPRIHHDDGEARRGQRRRGDSLQAAGSFQHN